MAADIRVYQMANSGVAVDDLKGAPLQFNGKRWADQILAHGAGASGPAVGLVQVHLIEL